MLTTIRRNIVRAGIVAVLAGIAFTGGYLTHQPHTVTVVHTTDDVSSFNDGFMTAKQDCK